MDDSEIGLYAMAARLPWEMYYDGHQDIGRMLRENMMGQPLMRPEHGVPSEAQASQLDVLEDERKSLTRRVLLLGRPRAEPPALSKWLITSRYSSEFLRKCHSRPILLTPWQYRKYDGGCRAKHNICTILALACVYENHRS